MPYRRNTYDFVIDSSFRPFTMQEMLVPFTAYKDAYEKTEEAYTNLRSKADKFKYLAENLPDGSKAKEIYQGYANDLKAQVDDFSANGLTMSNRGALTDLRGRYEGEIGVLDEAKTAMLKEQELRRQMNAKDPSMLWANNNFTLDDYLFGNTPNTYGISGDSLFAKGAAIGKSLSSREYSDKDGGSTLGGYYRQWISQHGINPQSIAAFMQSDEVQSEIARQMKATGAEDNLVGNEKEKARAQLESGIYNGIVYEQTIKPVRDEGVLSKAEELSNARADRQYNEITKPTFDIAKEKWDREKEEDDIRRSIIYRQKPDGTWEYNPTYINNSDYEMDPNGRWRKKTTTTSAEEKAATKEATAKGTALMKLEKKDLAHNSGFDVTFGDNRHHYDYIGAVSKHDGEWKEGAIGEDVPGRSFDWTSSSNVMHWGNFSAEGADKKTQMRILSEDDVMRLLSNDPELDDAIQKRINKYCKENGIDPDSPEAASLDIQIVEVPNEGRAKSRKGYLIAIH